MFVGLIERYRSKQKRMDRIAKLTERPDIQELAKATANGTGLLRDFPVDIEAREAICVIRQQGRSIFERR